MSQVLRQGRANKRFYCRKMEMRQKKRGVRIGFYELARAESESGMQRCKIIWRYCKTHQRHNNISPQTGSSVVGYWQTRPNSKSRARAAQIKCAAHYISDIIDLADDITILITKSHLIIVCHSQRKVKVVLSTAGENWKFIMALCNRVKRNALINSKKNL